MIDDHTFRIIGTQFDRINDKLQLYKIPVWFANHFTSLVYVFSTKENFYRLQLEEDNGVSAIEGIYYLQIKGQ